LTEATDKALIEFLLKPESYGLPPETPVEHVETHISHVFLAGPRAFKLKKPVRFTFLDFSDVEKRRAACETEVALNRRTAPGIYLAVKPVRRTAAGGFRLDGGEGEIADWLVEMKRFAADGLLATKAARGTLDLSLVEALAADVARFHASAEIHREAGGAESFLKIVEDNLADMEPQVGPVFDRGTVSEVDRACRALVERHRMLLDARRDKGFVRHCHGDLHLGNVTEIDGQPVIFDCIEFNDSIARIDMLYDLAFLLMDLSFRARADARLARHANRALNVYLDHVSGPDIAPALEGLALLPLFAATRAVIRAKVTAAQAKKGEAEEKRQRARAYLDFAVELLKPVPPRLVAMGGLSGTGKSTVAKALAPVLGGATGAVHLRTDIIRKRIFAVAPFERLPEAAYAPGVGARVYEETLRLAGLALEAGQSVIVDAVFARPGERAAAERLAANLAVLFTGLWLEAPADVLEARVAAREREGRDPSDAGVAVLKKQLTYDLGEMTWRKVGASGTPEETLKYALSAIDRNV
jgi:hypothetical protein